MKYKDEYIEILKELAESKHPMIAPYQMHFTEQQVPLILELIDANKVSGEIEHRNRIDLTKISGIKITLSGRLFLDEIEQDKKRNTFAGKITSDTAVGVYLGIAASVISQCLIKWLGAN